MFGRAGKRKREKKRAKRQLTHRPVTMLNDQETSLVLHGWVHDGTLSWRRMNVFTWTVFLHGPIHDGTATRLSTWLTLQWIFSFNSLRKHNEIDLMRCPCIYYAKKFQAHIGDIRVELSWYVCLYLLSPAKKLTFIWYFYFFQWIMEYNTDNTLIQFFNKILHVQPFLSVLILL